MKALKPIAIKQLLGIRNTLRPERQPWGALADAANVVLDDSGAIERREGYTKALHIAMGASDLFGAWQHEGLYGIAGGKIVSFDENLQPVALAEAIEDNVVWAELGDRVYYAGDHDAGVIVNRSHWLPLRIPVPVFSATAALAGTVEPGQYQVTATYTHLASGVEGPAAPVVAVDIAAGQQVAVVVEPLEGYIANVYLSECNGAIPYCGGVPLGHEQYDAQPMPERVTALAASGGALYAAVHDPDHNVGFVFWSQPFYPECWRLATDYVSVPGRVLGLAAAPWGLLIVTDIGCWQWSGESLIELARRGGVGGRPIATDRDGGVWVWTTHGLFAWTAERFRNVTEDHVSVAPGGWCTTQIIERHGSRYLIALTDGAGSPANAYSAPPAGSCWVVNLRTGEMTHWTDFHEFYAFGHFRGADYGVKGDGLYRLGGDTDAGHAESLEFPIAARIRLHPTDFGDSTLKRCTYAYITGCDDTALTVTPTADGQVVGSYTARRRVPLARGVQGQYWEFEIADGYGGALRLTGLEILVEPTTRRV